ncbi:hypothetical protein BKA62DRAFT_714109, partial [Auriculariales sp. MPI-PUGE-AT-0066]
MLFVFRQCARQATSAARPLTIPRASIARPTWRGAHSLRADLPLSTKLANPPVWKHVLFCLGVSGGVLAYGAYKTETETQRIADKLSRTGLTFQPRDMRNARRIEQLEGAERSLRDRNAGKRDEDLSLQEKLVRGNILVPWFNTSEEDKFKWYIVAGCVAVWIAWQAPPLRSSMQRWFSHDPLRGHKVTHLSSAFSHQDLAHLAFNLIAFSSFVPVAVATMDRDEVAQHPRGFIAAGALLSSLASHLWSIRVRLPRAVRALRSTAPTLRNAAGAQAAVERHSIGPSLGLSGVVYAVAVYPTIADLPSMFSFPMGYGVAGLCALDIVGLIRGWRTFDHAAHLGGALFGLFWYYGGATLWTTLRNLFQRQPKYIDRADPPVNPYGK